MLHTRGKYPYQHLYELKSGLSIRAQLCSHGCIPEIGTAPIPVWIPKEAIQQFLKTACLWIAAIIP